MGDGKLPSPLAGTELLRAKLPTLAMKQVPWQLSVASRFVQAFFISCLSAIFPRRVARVRQVKQR